MKIGPLMTAADFEGIAPLLGSCELVEGEILPTSPGGAGHSRVTTNAVYVLEGWNRRTGAGHVLTNEAGIVVREHPDTVR